MSVFDLQPARRTLPPGVVRAECLFDDETFAEIVERAAARDAGFAEEVLHLVTIALETLKGER